MALVSWPWQWHVFFFRDGAGDELERSVIWCMDYVTSTKEEASQSRMWDKPGTSAIGTLQPTKKRNTSLAREKRKRLSKTLNIVLGGGKKGRKQKDKSSDIFFNQPVFNLPLLLRSHMAFCLQGSSYNLRRAVFLPQLSTGVGFCSNNKRKENPN